VLIANPGQEIRTVELAAGPGVRAPEAVALRSAAGQPLLDDVARRTYRHRLAQVEEQLDRCAADDVPRVDELRTEREWLIAELAATSGRAGRMRVFPNNDERARIAVSKAIRRAIARIASADPALGRHLQETVHTGTRCSYQP